MNSHTHVKCYEDWFQEKRGYCMIPTFWDVENDVKTFEVKTGDVWINTFPKSGTTWMQETVWLLTHNLDFEAAKTLLKFRSPTFEACWAYKHFESTSGMTFDEFRHTASLSGGRRVLKTHLHWELLPEKLHKRDSPGKIVYVARNPKDVCVSYYYYLSWYKNFYENGITLDEFCKTFMSGKFAMGPYFAHVNDMWAHRHEPNIMFVMYEDMKKNLSAVVKELAAFLEVPVPTGCLMEKLVQHLSFDSMKRNSAVNKPGSFKNSGDDESRFIRKGIVGDWKEKLSPTQANEFDEWIRNNTKNSGLIFQDSL